MGVDTCGVLCVDSKQEELSPLEDYNRNRKNQLLKRAWENMITIKELIKKRI